MFVLTDAQIDELVLLMSDSKWPEAYRKVADWGEGQAGVSTSCILWLRGAAKVNENLGPENAFIRSYNAAQYSI